MIGRGSFRRLSVTLAEEGYIEPKYTALYEKGVGILISLAVNLLTMLLIGGLMNMFLECICLLCAFCPLRSYVGGYHASTYMRCYIGSNCLIASALLLIRFFTDTGHPAIMIMLVTSLTVILWLAPLPDPNRPISEDEKRVFGKRARIIAILEGLIGTVLIIAFQTKYGYAIVMAVILSSLVLMMHKVKAFIVKET